MFFLWILYSNVVVLVKYDQLKKNKQSWHKGLELELN